MGCGAGSQRYSHAEEDTRPAPLPRTQQQASSAAGAAVQGASSQQRSEQSRSQRSEPSRLPPPPPIPSAGARTAKVPAGVPTLDLADFERLEVLDETPMSVVFRFRNRRSGTVVAGKRIRKGCKIHASGDHLNEVRMLQRLSKVSGVVALHGICDDSGPDFWTVLELCSGGRLEAWLDKFPDTAHRVARELLEVVQHLHSLNICHLDIKPDNVLLTNSGNVRLIDFVTACELQAAGQQLVGNCGTEGFKAPEILSGRGYSGILADVFSLGRTLQVIAHADPAWRELAKVSTQMTVEDPQRRPQLAFVHTSLFGGRDVGGSDDGPALDFASLDTVSSREASQDARRGPSSVAPPGAMNRSRSLAQPPELRSRWSSAKEVDPRPAKPNGPIGANNTRERPNNQPFIGGKVVASVEIVRKTPVPSQMQSSLSKAPRKAPVTNPAIACGSALCARLGSCLCNDNPSAALAQTRPEDRPGARKGLRRSNS